MTAARRIDFASAIAGGGGMIGPVIGMIIDAYAGSYA
jgi:hypothetical protein